MIFTAFKVTNFRSIVDTEWRNFSADNVTVLIGQNESGKTSILEALSKTFSQDDISADDTRIEEPLPKVFLKSLLDEDDIDYIIDFLTTEGYNTDQLDALSKHLKKNPELIIMFHWEADKGKFKKTISVVSEEIETLLEESVSTKPPAENDNKENQDAEKSEDSSEEKSEKDVGTTLEMSGVLEGIYEISPYVTFFNHETGLLPSKIDIDEEKYVLKGKGAIAARNFLTVAGLDLKTLVNSDPRTRETLLLKANNQITKDFANFWSQTIGETSKLNLECQVQTYGPEEDEKSGQKHLLFWVNNGLRKLYPKQRSQGVRWFVSFYLQLKASEKKSSNQVFLLDEPGANLHSKAQNDVIKLINELSEDIPIVYSTHIPHMLEYDKLYRVLAVQRIEDDIDNPTEVKPAHELGTASSDTLSPVLTSMGVDLYNQEVIKRENNVLLEEMSGFYYLKSFWELTKEKQEAHFIAATGVNKIPALANMFIGWGLGYIIVTDDDGNGRSVYNKMKKDLYLDDQKLADENMYKIKECHGIEDIFSENDFKKFIIDDASATISKGNAAYMNEKSISKPVSAYKFLIAVRENKVSLKEFDATTQKNIKDLVKAVSSRLKPAKKTGTKKAA